MCSECRRNPCPPQCPNYEPEVVGYCYGCQNPIYEGDTIYIVDCEGYCEDCIDSFKTKAEKEK